MDTAKLLALVKSKKQAVASAKRSATLKPKPGTNRYVLLPGWRKGEEETFSHDFGQHFVKNEAGVIQAVHVCMQKTYGQPCAICDGVNKAIHMAPDDETVAVLKGAISGQSYLLNVLALDEEDPGTPKILEVRKTVYTQLLEMVEQWGESIFDPAEPLIFHIVREGTGFDTKYLVQPSPKKQRLPAGVLGKLNNLDDYVRQENEETKVKALGAISAIAGLLPSADTPKTATSRPVGTGATTTLDDDDVLASLEKGRPTADDVKLDDELTSLLADLDGTNN